MKTRTIIFFSALLALTSCGSAAQYASDTSSQRYQDGIYYTSDAQAAEMASSSDLQQETDLLVAKTKSSPIYMKSGARVDTLFIPNDKVAKIDINKAENTTSVYLYDTGWDTWAAYQPWYRPYYSSLYWGASPWYYGGWYDPWYYRPYYHYGWYDPWYYRPYYHYGWYGGWYDPWFYDPWYYGGWYGGWYDPWFYDPWYYGGWYGGYSWHYHGWGHVNHWGNIGFGGGDRVYRPRIATTASANRSGIGSVSRSAGTRSSSMTRNLRWMRFPIDACTGMIR